jgi:hypothetical protein
MKTVTEVADSTLSPDAIGMPWDKIAEGIGNLQALREIIIVDGNALVTKRIRACP